MAEAKTPILYHFPPSRSMKILWLWHELVAENGASRIPLEIKEVNLLKGEQKSDWYKKVNPAMVIPAYTMEDGTIMVESPVIFKYFVQKYDFNKKLGGEEGSEKAKAIERLVGTPWAADAEANIINICLHSGKASFGLPFFMRDSKVLKESMAKWPAIQAELLAQLGDKQYFAGDEFSAVDVSVGYMMNKAKDTQLLNTPETKPLLDYWHRLDSRETFHKLPALGGEFGFSDAVCNIQ